MRRSSRMLLLIFVFPFLLLGCESKEFKAERQLWQAHRQARVIYQNPKVTPQAQVKTAQDAYAELIKEYPGTIYAVQSQFSIGHLFLASGDYQKARNAYSVLLQNCDKQMALCANVCFAIGKSYEAEGKWDQALAEYLNIMRDYPTTSTSLELPIYIISVERNSGNEQTLQRALDKAVSFYLDLKSKDSDENHQYLFSSLVVRSFVEARKWQEALQALDNLAKNYPKHNPDGALWLRVLIYANKLNDKAQAKHEIERILKEYPQTKLAKPLQALLEKL